MRCKDFDQNIKLVDEEIAKVHEKLLNKNLTSEHRKELREELDQYTDIQLNAVRTKNEHKNNWVPSWLINVASIAVTTVTSMFVFKKVTKLEESGGVVSSQGVNIWDKIVRKYGF